MHHPTSAKEIFQALANDAVNSDDRVVFGNNIDPGLSESLLEEVGKEERHGLYALVQAGRHFFGIVVRSEVDRQGEFFTGGHVVLLDDAGTASKLEKTTFDIYSPGLASIVVGRDTIPHAKLRQDRKLSRRHFEVGVTEDQFSGSATTVHDLGSTNGTSILTFRSGYGMPERRPFPVRIPRGWLAL